MKLITLIWLAIALCSWEFVYGASQPKANPKMFIEQPTGTDEYTSFTGSAPIIAHFYANIENLGEYTPLYEWRVYENEKADDPYIVRFDENMDITFKTSTTYNIFLQVSFVNGKDTINYIQESPFTITINQSILNVPNAFTPNGDGFNDIFKVKDGYQSIIKFHGYIFNRQGKKLFEWTNISEGWDGTYAGRAVAEGVYFCRIEAEGADGRKYDIKKAVNLIRGYRIYD